MYLTRYRNTQIEELKVNNTKRSISINTIINTFHRSSKIHSRYLIFNNRNPIFRDKYSNK